MARQEARVNPNLINIPMPIVDLYRGLLNSATTVTTAAAAIPATNLSQRRAIILQSLEAGGGDNVYIGGCIPELVSTPEGEDKKIVGTKKILKWNLSANGTNEYYVTTPSGNDPGLNQTLVAYAVLTDGAAETLLTNGTVGTLVDHAWDWGNNDTLGFNTLYFADASGDPDTNSWFQFISYWRMPDASANFGLKLAPGHDPICLNISGSVRLFAVVDANTAVVATLEFV